jgi:hypothetical protein
MAAETLADELLEEQLDTQPAKAVTEVPAEHMMLRMPRSVPYIEGFEFPEGNIDFGPATRHAPNHDEVNIQFHAEGDGDGYAIVRADHPMLDALMRRYPQVEVVESNPKPEAYLCEVCGKEYKTARALLTHKRGH